MERKSSFLQSNEKENELIIPGHFESLMHVNKCFKFAITLQCVTRLQRVNTSGMLLFLVVQYELIFQ